MMTSTSLTRRALERVRYFPRQLITAEDMTDEQQFFVERLRRHNRYQHGGGVVCGCDVEPLNDQSTDAGKRSRVRVCPGYVVDPGGNEIHLSRTVDIDLADPNALLDPCARPRPCPPVELPEGETEKPGTYIAVRYVECVSRPVRVHPAGCACDEAVCEYSRTRDDFEVRVLSTLPPSHRKAKDADKAWCEEVAKWKAAGGKSGHPVPSCADLECDDGWVVLANVNADQKTIDYTDRRVLYTATTLHLFLTCP